MADFPTAPPMRSPRDAVWAHWGSRSAVTSPMPSPLAEIFLAITQPLQNGLAPVEGPPAYGHARWPGTAHMPAIQRPFANSQFAGEFFRCHIFGENRAG